MEVFKKYIAEFIGTCVLVFAACGTAVAVGCNGAVGDAAYLMTALAFGLVIVAMAYSIGNISGCHINPAVTLAVWINKGISGKDAIFYVISQVLGGAFGALLLGLVAGFDTPYVYLCPCYPWRYQQEGILKRCRTRYRSFPYTGTYLRYPLHRNFRKPCKISCFRTL